nr:hypothetical protein CFP56_62742 [Quercus suber]
MAAKFVPTQTCRWKRAPLFDDGHASSLLPHSSDSSTTPSFFVTLKVLQIVRSLCKRTDQRVRVASSNLASKHRVKARQNLCQPYELEVYDKIDRYLGRKTARNHRQKQASCYRTPTTISSKAQFEASIDKENTTRRDSTLDQIDKQSRSRSCPLAAIARSNKLFVERDQDFDLRPLSLNGLAKLVVLTKDLLQSFAPTKHGCSVRTLCEGNDILDAEETYVANLQHLLLCLYHQLLELLVVRLVELAHKQLKESQKDQERQWIDWFFEFPDARHPLSTTWPWSIRPSLAVIWGVCWMFFDSPKYRIDQHGNMVNDQDEVVVPYQYSVSAEQYLRNLQARRGSHQSVPAVPAGIRSRSRVVMGRASSSTGGPAPPRSPRCVFNRHTNLRPKELAHKQLKESQKDQERQWIDWFFEFPDARHPLSTTWPWSIRPSLAVIWGVCWMFFDSPKYRIDQHGNMVNDQDEVVVPYQYSVSAEQYLRNLQARRGSHQSDDNGNRGGDGGRSGRAMQSQPFQQEFVPDHVSSWVEHRHPQAGQHRHAAHAVSSTVTPIYDQGTTLLPDNRARGLPGGLGTSSTPIIPPSTATSHLTDHWLPQENFDATSTSDYHQIHPGQASADVLPDWTFDLGQDGRSHLPQASPPQPPPSSRQTPVIRLQTAGLPTFSQPQDTTYHSATSAVSSASSLYHSDDFHTRARNNTYSGRVYNHNNLSPHSPLPRAMSQEISSAVMHTPVSSISPQPHSHSDAHTMSQLVRELVEEASRKRSFSEMSQNGRPQMHPVEHPHSRAVSVGSAAQGEASPAADQDSPRGSRSFKRSDPPTNAEGKYCCNFSNDCSALTFDRKCEWSKHMDKHDRPYRCQDPLCAKLQGFTYSGGLLRHEREVHNKHGGPKEQLMCPVADCKRHSGKGFTRKENLHEHMRRVHENKTHGVQSPNAIASLQVNLDGLQGVGENPDASAPREMTDMVGPDDLVEPLHFSKRQRSGVPDTLEISVNNIDALQHQLKRLREEKRRKRQATKDAGRGRDGTAARTGEL